MNMLTLQIRSSQDVKLPPIVVPDKRSTRRNMPGLFIHHITQCCHYCCCPSCCCSCCSCCCSLFLFLLFFISIFIKFSRVRLLLTRWILCFYYYCFCYCCCCLFSLFDNVFQGETVIDPVDSVFLLLLLFL